ncbi:TPA: cytochrome c5 family protein [Legionella pneumophila]|uniref:Cytochrome c5 family protein n=2 Tax=Legionella pneumophila TaxID=446 RepID=A0AAN5T9K2_LEGPN|nr:cytochrome c5 family protein [Legionella pneumophila]HAT7003939.1 cytochrome c5 family protein [Legionella pneumophila]HAT7743874.1 cytochrome c5 family protein [Legionella pneumophila]HAT7938405.1 cytochrome c5 family protein [Legionella pneumophila]HAT7945927.1 cytochrome c5 family protein [Legionella pneumophila]
MIFKLTIRGRINMRLNIALILSFFSIMLFAMDEVDEQQILQRIQPVGKVRVQEEQGNNIEAEATKTTVVDSKSKKEPGQNIYDKYCSVCHRDGLAGAPKFQSEADWKPRLASKKIDDLLASAIKGLNAMPAKGTCMDCSDAELKAAIQYMLPKS